MGKLRICRGSVSLNGKSNKATVKFGPLKGSVSVTATIVGSLKNGPTVCIRSRSSGSATFACFYNGGLELKEGTIDWIAVGGASDAPLCCCNPLVLCQRDVFAG